MRRKIAPWHILVFLAVVIASIALWHARVVKQSQEHSVLPNRVSAVPMDGFFPDSIVYRIIDWLEKPTPTE